MERFTLWVQPGSGRTVRRGAIDTPSCSTRVWLTADRFSKEWLWCPNQEWGCVWRSAEQEQGLINNGRKDPRVKIHESATIRGSANAFELRRMLILGSYDTIGQQFNTQHVSLRATRQS